MAPIPLRGGTLPLGQLRWWMGFAVLLAFLLNEAVGSVPLFLSLGGVCVAAVTRVERTLRGFAVAGLAPWLVPLLALCSITWSSEVAITLRLSLELILTVGMAMVIAEQLDPDEVILAICAATGLICLASLGINHPYYDGMTGRTSWAGIYQNKNSLCTCAAMFAMSSAAVAANARYHGVLRLSALGGIAFGLLMAVLARAVATIAACGVMLMCFGVLYLSHMLPRGRRSFYFEIVGMVLVVGGALGGLLVLSNAELFLGLVGKDPTLTGRTLLWAFASRLAQDHPVLGVGYQAFWVQGHTAAELLWKTNHISTRSGFHFHSLYYIMLTELGYVGVALALHYFLRTFLATLRWTRLTSSSASIFFFTYTIYMAISSLQGPGLFGYFNPDYALFVIGLAQASRLLRGSRYRRLVSPRQAGLDPVLS